MASSGSGSSGSKGKGAQGVETSLRWKHRTHFNFIVGRSILRALPVVVHLLSDDIDWFSEDSSLFDDLKSLLRDRVISTTGDGGRDPEPPRSRKRARKEEVCIQGERLQFTYRYRKTCPRYTVLQYADDGVAVETGAGTSGSRSTTSSAGAAGDKGSASRGGFRHLPLSESTLLVWVYRFDFDDPYRAVPNAAALQFAPPAKSSADEPLDVEAAGQYSRSAAEPTAAQAGPRDAGLLSWLWGTDGEDGIDGGGSSSSGRVRQHFIGSAAWQGRPGPVTERRGQHRDEEEDDIQRAIALSLAEEGVEGGTAGEQDLVEVQDDEN